MTHKTKKLSAGDYLYRGNRIRSCGYYEPEHRVAWEATDEESGYAVAHGYTKRQVMWFIDDLLEKTD